MAFGKYTISFKGCTDSMEDVFGSEGIPPSQMIKRIWEYVKEKKLSSK